MLSCLLVNVVLAPVAPVVLGQRTANDPLDAILAKEEYIRPAPEILASVQAPWFKNISISNLSPDRESYLSPERDPLVPLAILGRPSRVLGGMDVELAGRRNRDLLIGATPVLRLGKLDGKPPMRIENVAPLGMSGATWSPDGKSVALIGHHEDASYLYVIDAATGKARRVTAEALQPTLNTGLTWVNGGKEIVATFRPGGGKEMPVTPAIADRPLVRTADASRTSLRTYQGLLQDEHDARLFEYFATTEIGRVDVRSGRVTRIGAAAMFSSVSPSPDGKAFRVTATLRPFTYLAPMSSFANRSWIMDETGKEIIELSKNPMRLGNPGGGPPTPGPGGRGGGGQEPVSNDRRNLTWAVDGNGMTYLQLEPANREQPAARRKDRLYRWIAPYRPEDAKVIYESETRIGSVQFTRDPNRIAVTQTRGEESVTFLVDLREPTKETVIQKRRTTDNEPGSPSLMTAPGPVTGSVLRLSKDGNSVFLTGTTFEKTPFTKPPMPYIEKFDFGTGITTRIWEASATMTESATALDDDCQMLLVSRSSPREVGNTWLINRASGASTKLTDNRDYNPDVTQAEVQQIQVTRADGMKFYVTVTIPRGAGSTPKRPAVFWFYPNEPVDQAAYDRTLLTRNVFAFRQPSASAIEHFLKMGYVVVEPDCPIFAPADRKNDSYVPQLRNNLSATIDELSERGLIDRKRLAIGGHSYGAFSTANAMVHTPFFKAGIAGDGAYNRTLTPHGFQSEQRTFWEAREVYLTMSPMLYAEQMTGALLMYHGKEDQNMGTWPINSERMFMALEALGKPCAMYMYPYEDHGQVAMETRLDMWARWTAWIEKWLGKP